jgi:hypothetical protein
MRLRFIAAAAAVVAIFAAPLIPAAILSSKAAFISKAMADDAPKDVKGLFLMSDYPAVTLRPGETSTVSLRLQN